VASLAAWRRTILRSGLVTPLTAQMCRSVSPAGEVDTPATQFVGEDGRVSSLDRAIPDGPRSPKDYQALAESPGTPPDVLRDLAAKDFSFVAEALAGNVSTPSDVLRDLVPATVGGWNANRLLELVASHPRADPAVLELCAIRVTEALSQQQDRGHPYSAALALAGRPEVPIATVLEWLAMPGASARFRHGLQNAIDGRALNT